MVRMAGIWALDQWASVVALALDCLPPESLLYEKNNLLGVYITIIFLSVVTCSQMQFQLIQYCNK